MVFGDTIVLLSSAITVNLQIEQGINLKFLVKFKKPMEYIKILKQELGDNAMWCVRFFEWHKRISEVQEKVEENERFGRTVSARSHRRHDEH